VIDKWRLIMFWENKFFMCAIWALFAIGQFAYAKYKGQDIGLPFYTAVICATILAAS